MSIIKYNAIYTKVMELIKKQYPSLSDECARQMEKHSNCFFIRNIKVF